jgi:hypothetical protein
MEDREITGIGDALGAAFDRFKAEKEPVVLIAILVALLNMMLIKSLLSTYTEAVQNLGSGSSLDDLSQAVLDGDFTLGIILLTVISVMAYILFGRLLVVGRESIFEGGPSAYLNRLMWTLWRYICLVGWVVLMFAPYFLIATFGLKLGGSLGILAATAAFIFLLVAIISLSLSFGVSLVAAANDIAVPIRQAWLALRGYHIKFGLAALVMFIGFFVVAMLLMSIFISLGVVNPNGDISIGMSIYYVIYMTLSSILGFIIFGMAYFLARNNVDEQNSVQAGGDD